VPRELLGIPFAETKGIVLDIKNVVLNDIVAPYNASLLEDSEGFLLFFRYDVIKPWALPLGFHSYIGTVHLDHNFKQDSPSITLDTGSNHSEDPRATKINGQIYLSYNDEHPDNLLCRSMHLAKFNTERKALESFRHFNPHLQTVEKNWTPFEYTHNKKPELCFEYRMSPHVIIHVPNAIDSSPTFMLPPEEMAPTCFPWSSIWGAPRGGTGARKLDDCYLSFFHSSFRDEDNLVWYVMGAYTFELTYPFRITAVSHHPILFRGIYNSPRLNTASPALRAIFPCGFALENREGRALIHLACGENDSAVKVLTIDQDALLKSLKKIQLPPLPSQISSTQLYIPCPSSHSQISSKPPLNP